MGNTRATGSRKRRAICTLSRRFPTKTKRKLTFRVDHLQVVDGHLEYFRLFEFSGTLLFESARYETFQFRKGRVDPVAALLLYDSSAFLPREHLTTVRVSRGRASKREETTEI